MQKDISIVKESGISYLMSWRHIHLLLKTLYQNTRENKNILFTYGIHIRKNVRGLHSIRVSLFVDCVTVFVGLEINTWGRVLSNTLPKYDRNITPFLFQ